MSAVAVWIEVNPRDGVPIYVQIVDQVRHALEVGGLRPGERLPTVRQLASELTIAPNTIVKAYNELQRMGLVESRPGVGTVVAQGVEEIDRERRVEAIFGRLRVLVRDAAALGISEDELLASLDAEFERIPSDVEEER
ncbi:MAG: GntR family transcriptional regulator [Actinomycetota bacterium]|nr:GntR family transcriptional regulator [Actinomycetota bacterium]